jgi:hypothetical protein
MPDLNKGFASKPGRKKKGKGGEAGTHHTGSGLGLVQHPNSAARNALAVVFMGFGGKKPGETTPPWKTLAFPYYV